jgi:murein DD-endopeptidase MepM/ murein hydrolase activator NlpD
MRVHVEAPNASAVVIDFRDVSYHMLRQADGSFWLAVGVPLDASTGAGDLAGTARDAFGATLASADAAYEVITVERPVDYLELTPDEASVLTPDAAARESELRGLQFAQFDPLPRWSDFLLRPVDGPITTYFGQGRSINGGPIGAFHTGVDLANDEGTPVQVAAPGRVAWTGEMPIRGNSVIVDHGGGVKTGYHHLSVISSTVDQEVAAGEIIGLVGMTGLATGPHLHWELTLWGVNVDPMTWLTKWFGP